MRPLYSIIIETDPRNSLGGSCIRDLYNIANNLLKNSNKINLKKIFVFTTNKLSEKDKKKFPQQCDFNVFIDFRKQLNLKVNQIPINSTLLVAISGHGYQKRDINGDEMDGMDEYVRTCNEIIIDDDLWEIFIKNMNKSINFVGICDTCHSGTMFDLDYFWNGNEWILDTKRNKVYRNAISIGACKDNQLDNCDIGETIGFGGCLTIQLIEHDYLCKLLEFDEKKFIDIHSIILNNLKNFGQQPVIQTNYIN